MFRSAGNIIRADINIGADGRPKGSGTVVFETPKDAQQAICEPHDLFHSFILLGLVSQFDSYVSWFRLVWSYAGGPRGKRYFVPSLIPFNSKFHIPRTALQASPVRALSVVVASVVACVAFEEVDLGADSEEASAEEALVDRRV